jgi:hypothetical protein
MVRAGRLPLLKGAVPPAASVLRFDISPAFLLKLRCRNRPPSFTKPTPAVRSNRIFWDNTLNFKALASPEIKTNLGGPRPWSRQPEP